MGSKYRIVAISSSLSKQINDMQKKIEKLFGLNISKIQASKIISWKSDSYNLNLSKSKLVEILGMPELENG